ncbi:MAG: hypothetical protein AAFY15_00520 [Cyanobacteria bacterium J06648_11]
MGRPKIPISDRDIQQIEVMAGLGMKLDDIALVLNISPTTLDRWLKDERVKMPYKKGVAMAKLTVSKTLFDKAKGGDMTAIIWFEKTRCGMSDRVQVDASHEVHAPAVDPDAITLDLPDEEIDRRLNVIQARMQQRLKKKAEREARNN